MSENSHQALNLVLVTFTFAAMSVSVALAPTMIGVIAWVICGLILIITIIMVLRRTRK